MTIPPNADWAIPPGTTTTAPTAVFDPTRTYRYTLHRSWGTGGTVAFIGLNPSTADEVQDDPTVRRCKGYARAWGYGAMVMLNLFALRSTDPRVLYSHPSPCGPGNSHHIAAQCHAAALVVACWGAHGALGGRGQQVEAWLRSTVPHKAHCLGRTKGGQPRHPLYLRADLQPVPLC